MHHYTDAELRNLLGIESPKVTEQFKAHLNTCKQCWDRWNHLKWELAKSKKGFQELEMYLGKSFQWYLDSSWELAKEWNQLNPKSFIEVEQFYKNTENYLYNLTLWHESGDRYDLLPELKQLDNQMKINSCLDYGCGIGTDGLKMIELDKRVFFYDFENPSTKFLEWRLAKRAVKGKILFVENTQQFPNVDLVWAIDVLEHMVNPLKILEAFSEETKAFAHVSQFGQKRGGRHPFHFEFNEQILNKALEKKGFEYDDSFKTLTVWVKR